MNIQAIDFSTLEIKEIGLWPLILRIIIMVLVSVLTLVAAYYLVLKDKFELIDKQHGQEEEKRKEFKEKYNLAANLSAYEKQMIEVKERYKQLLQELPSSDQLPELIDNITRQAENNGLKYQSIKPGAAKSLLGFYKELPIDLVVSGTYNGFGGFVSDLSKIPRIVTLHDFSIKRAPSTEDSPQNSLVMNISAKTYWLSPDEESAKDPKSKDKDAKNPAAKNPKQPRPASMTPELPAVDPAGAEPKT